MLFVGCSDVKIENFDPIELQDSIVHISFQKAEIYENAACYDTFTRDVVWMKPIILERYAELKYPDNITRLKGNEYSTIIEGSEIPQSSDLRKFYKVISMNEFDSLGYVVDSTIEHSYIEVSKPFYDKETKSFYLEVTTNANNGREFVVFGKLVDSQIQIDSIVTEKMM